MFISVYDLGGNCCNLEPLSSVSQAAFVLIRIHWWLLITLPVLAQPGLMPWPASVHPDSGAIAIDAGFNIAITGYSDKRLDAAVGRILTRISRQTGTQFIGGKPTLSIECHGAGENESYQLDVTTTGAKLSADAVTGALRGLETFVQL